MTTQTESAPRRRRGRAMLWSLVAILALAVALPSLGYLVAEASNTHAPAGPFAEDRETNPRADLWRAARQGEAGFTTKTGPYVTNTLISNVGQNWRQVREGPLTTWGGWFLIGVLVAIAAFFAVVGQVKIAGGRANRTVPRWSLVDRFVHWFVAVTFIVLAVTGLSLLFGRTVLIPLFGYGGFAAYANIGMVVHNYVGPAFGIGLVAMILLWLRHNIPNRHDLTWFRQGGGIVGKGHPSAGKFNGGEKLWYWGGVVVLGLIVVVSGLMLNFPALGFTSREALANAQLAHAIGALLWIGGFFGHTYIATLGTEGALEGMTTGRVDANWAKQHHDLWYEEVIADGERSEPAKPTRPPAAAEPAA